MRTSGIYRLFLGVLLFLCLLPAAWAKSAGVITYLTGDATIQSTGQAARKAVKGAELQPGDNIETAANATLQMRMADGAMIALRPRSVFRIDQYRYAGSEDGSERSFFSLLKGALRTITGQIGHANRANYRMSTPVATIGIRGTEYALAYDGAAHVTVGQGSIDVCNDGGCLNLLTGQSAFVPDVKTLPRLTDKPVSFSRRDDDNQANFQDNASPDTNNTTDTSSLLGGSSNATIPLASGTGGLVEAYIKTSGGYAYSGGGQLGGTLTFNSNGALVDFTDCCSSISFTSPTLAEYGADGIVAWGRWTGGTYDHFGSPYPLATFSFVGGTTSPNATVLSTLSGTYTVYASTAPVGVDSYGNVTAVGTPNSVTGTLNANYGVGTVGYNLSVPLASEVFTLSGTAYFLKQYSTDNRFSDWSGVGGSGTVTSSGSGCSPSCTGGVIDYTTFIQGNVFGTNGERIGINYGFTSPTLGSVTGAVVFKP